MTLDLNVGFWKKRKVLITGHTGFKGSWLSLWLQSLGADLFGYSLAPPTTPNLYQLAKISEGMESVHGDVRDLTQLKQAIASHRPEILIHMAAQSLVRTSYNNPIETYETNVLGTANVLEAVRGNEETKVVLIVTSDKCYENREWVWGYREYDTLGGHDPYSSSKACAELVTAAYRSSFFNSPSTKGGHTALASVRAGNVIGGGDWSVDRLVPDVMRAVIENRPVVIRNPGSIRPWQHVLDPLAGYLLLSEKLFIEGKDFAESWNFGPQQSDAKSVLWITQQLAEMWSGKVRWNVDQNQNPHEAFSLRLDCSKASTRLGWQPRWDINDALKATVEWYAAYLAGQNIRDFTIQQISCYLSDRDKAAQ